MHSAEDDLNGQKHNDKHYGKVYRRRGHGYDFGKLSIDQETNPNPFSFDDPSIDDIEGSTSDGSEIGKGEAFINGEQGTPYPVERYMSYLKVSKNYKYFISSLADNVVPKTLAYAQCDPK